MPENPHFVLFDDLDSAEEALGFAPLARRIRSRSTGIRAHIRDHRMRDVQPTLEVQYGDFVMSQARLDPGEARARALDRSYGESRRESEVGGHAAACYEQGPEPEPGDPDPRLPAVVTWADDADFVMLASDSLPVDTLLDLAESLYE